MTELVEKVAEEIAKKLPVERVYDDVASGAAKQTGIILTDLVKTVRLALAPFQLTAAFQDRLETFIEKSVRQVPVEQRIPPAPQILGPILEGIRYEPEGSEIEAMFIELLSRSVDRDRVNEAHPSYPIVIKQLSTDEARIITLLKGPVYDYVFVRPLDPSQVRFGPQEVEVDSFPIDQLQFPNNLGFYFQHLESLSLAHIQQVGLQEPIKLDGTQTGIRVRCKYKLTELGLHFARACTGK
jgi:hypothetical protein